MTIYNITGDDTFTVNGTVLNDFADGDISTLSFENDKWKLKTGKNGNSIWAYDYTGGNCKTKLRIMIGSSDDSLLQGILTTSDNSPAATVLINGQFVKNLGDGAGNMVRNVFTLLGGMIVRIPDAKGNAEGDTNQGVAEYMITFANATRSIQ